MLYKPLKSYLASPCLSGSSHAPVPTRRTSHRASASAAITGAGNTAVQQVQFGEAARRRAHVSAPVKVYVRHASATGTQAGAGAKRSRVAVTLPRYLVKPALRQVSADALKAVDPELENVPAQYVRDGLRLIGSRMISVLASTAAASVSSKVIPRDIQVTVQHKDENAPMTPPTHVLAIYNSQPMTARRVMLVPTHSLVLAAHCATLPHFPASPAAVPSENPQAGPSSTYTVPVVPLGIPSPETFVPLSSYLYTGRAEHLFGHFIPCSSKDFTGLFTTDSLSEDPDQAAPTTNDLTTHLATALSKSLSPQQLLQHAMRINGLWRNVCALGIYDEDLWRTMEVMWEVVVGAMGVGDPLRH